MDEFIARLNREHYREVLADECAPERRRLIERLLAEEEAKLAVLECRSGERQTGERQPGERQSTPATGDKAVSHLNLAYYRKRLENEADLVIRQILIRMIEEEEARGMPAPASTLARITSGED
ncbi:MAG: hypothetical protein P8Z80_10420 [Pseudolabrys sp.]